jgi:hypothetical protein
MKLSTDGPFVRHPRFTNNQIKRKRNEHASHMKYTHPGIGTRIFLEVVKNVRSGRAVRFPYPVPLPRC